MDTWEVLPIVGLCVLVSVLTFTLVKLLDHLRRRDAESEARQIVQRAEQEIDNRRREAELDIKQAAIAQEAQGKEELQKPRQELHQPDRSLDSEDSGATPDS